MGAATRVECEELGAGYWWSVRVDEAILHLRYGWVATVTATTVKVGPTGPYHPQVVGKSHGVAPGMRMVERLLSVRFCVGPPERALFRRRLLLARVARVRGPQRPVVIDGVEELLY